MKVQKESLKCFCDVTNNRDAQVRELRALIVNTPNIDNILSGKKTLEMRCNRTLIRGPIGLIRVGHPRKIIGVVEIIDSIGPFSYEEILVNQCRHLIPPAKSYELQDTLDKYAWVLQNARLLKQPVSCKQVAQATWVKLDAETSAAVMNAVA